MKHFTAILFLLLASMNSAFAIHSFVNESKLWHCKKWKQGLTRQEDRYYYFQGDTVINGITAKKMYLKFSKESDKGNYQAALYEEGQKVYRCYPNQKVFELVYDFGAKKGEEVTTSSFTYMVEDVEEMKVGDETLRVLHLYILHDLLNEKYSVTWVEGVGAESAPCYSGPNFTGGYEYFIDCEIDGKIFLKAEDIPDPTPNTPVDMTSHIVNPNYDNNDNEGWSGTTPLFRTYTNAEHYNKTFDTWQDITDLPNGVYKLSVQGFYRPSNSGRWDYESGDTPQYAVFYATNGIDSLISPIPNIHRDTDDSESLPNNMQQASEAFAAGKYVTTLHFVVSDHRVRIGIAQNEKAGDTDWVSWDNWQLTYYGNEGEASFNGAVKEMIDDNLTRFDTITEKISTGVVDAYKTTINNLTATDLASVNEAKQTIENAIDTVEANICAWEDYQKNVEEVIIFMSEYYEQLLWYDTSRKLYDYIQTEAPTYIEDLGLTTEKLLAQIAYLREMTNIVFIKGHPTKTVWSYVSFEQYTNESNEIKERNSYTRYLLDRGKWTNVGQASYHKLVEYTTCEYEEGQETNAYRIRWEGNRVYIHKEDAPDYAGSGIILKEEGDDYLLYDFNLNVGDEFCKWIHEGDTTSITVSEISFVTTTDGETFKAMRLSMGIGWWIEGFGSTTSFLYYIFPDAPTCVCGSSLNYAHESTIHRTVATYKNPFGDITAVSTAFKADDCALGADAIENVIKEQESAQVHTIGQTILCTSPTATKLEVYTMDAIKVGEAGFANGEASVKVDKVPATYLYIVTYPDGRRESGKVAVKD